MGGYGGVEFVWIRCEEGNRLSVIGAGGVKSKKSVGIR